MAIHRPLSGLAWFLVAAAGLFMLRPDLFPDLRPPADGDQRVMIGMLLVLVAVALAVAAAIEVVSHREKPRAPSYAGPMLAAEPLPQVAPAQSERTQAEPAPSEPHVAAEPSAEHNWAPLPPPRLVAGTSASVAPEPVAEEPAPVVATATGGDAMEAALRAGDAAHAEGQSEAAVEHYSAAVDAARALQAAQPDDLAVKASLAGALAKLADGCEAGGQANRARDLYAEAVNIHERLSWLEPTSEPRRAALDGAKARLEALKQEPSPEAFQAQISSSAPETLHPSTS